MFPPLRNFSEIIIDDNNWVQEIGCNNDKGETCPDMLFFSDPNFKGKRYDIKKELSLINEMSTNRCEVISHQDFISHCYDYVPHEHEDD
jgi:hypothetical protein